MTRAAIVATAAGLLACSAGPPRPAALDTRNDACAQCRMMVSDARFASQVVGGGEEPRFFDDLGCLVRYVRQKPLARNGAVFVADHRTKAWVPAASAVYAKVPGLQTPMGSGLVAHSDAASRAADPEARGGVPLAASDLLGPGAMTGAQR